MKTNTINKILGNKVKILRKQIGMTQNELAKHLGLRSSGIISQVENGERGLKRENILKCAEFFGIDECYLFSENNYSEKELRAMIGLKKLIENAGKSKAMKLRYEKVIELLTEGFSIGDQKK